MQHFVKKILLLTLLNISLFAAPSGVYIELGAGLGLDDTVETKDVNYVYNRAYIGSVALGFQIDTFRLELQERYKKDDLYSASLGNSSSIKVNGDFISNSQMLNFYYSGYNKSRLVSSIGVGAGITSLRLGDTIKDDGILSLQGMLSVGYQVSEDFITTIKYTYFHTSQSDSFKVNDDSAITFSLRYIF